jgi:hypothetical protein
MGYFDDPNMMAYLGMMAGLGQASAPSRLPVPLGVVMGDAAQGLMGGVAAGNQSRLSQQEAAGKRIGNLNDMLTLNMWRKAFGQPELDDSNLYGATGSSPGGEPQENSSAAGARRFATASSAPFGVPTADPAAREDDAESGSSAPGDGPLPLAFKGAGGYGSAAPDTVAPDRPSPMGAPGGGAGSGPGSAPGPMPFGLAPGAGGAPAGGGAPGTFMGLRLPSGMSPMAYMALSRMNPAAAARVLGNQYPGPTDYERARAYASGPGASDPLAAEAAAKAAGINPSPDLRPGGAALLFDPATRTYKPAYQQPQLPEGSIYQDGKAVPVPGADARLSAVERIKQGAIGDREKDVRKFASSLEFGDLGPAGAGAGGKSPGGAPGPASGGRGAATSGAAGGVAGIDRPYTTPGGTTIPPLKEQAPIPHDEASLRAAIPAWQKKDEAFNEPIGTAQQAIERLQQIAGAFKLTESGAFATDKAQLGAAAKALGLTLPQNWTGDVTAVQTALHENAVKTLQSLKAVTSRFTQMEFKTLSQQSEHPDLQPGANLKMLSEDIGAMRQEIAAGQDWRTAKFFGWRNPIDFDTAWKTANPVDNFIGAAEKEIGPLKGMPGGPGGKPAPGPKPDFIWDPVKGLQKAQ